MFNVFPLKQIVAGMAVIIVLNRQLTGILWTSSMSEKYIPLFIDWLFVRDTKRDIHFRQIYTIWLTVIYFLNYLKVIKSNVHRNAILYLKYFKFIPWQDKI